MLKDYWELIAHKLEAWRTSLVENLPNFVVAVLIVLTFSLIARLVAKVVERAVAPRGADGSTLGRIVASMARYAVIALGLFIGLEVLGLEKAVTSLLAGAGIVGLALGFAFQDLAANFIAGIILSVRKPFKVGDLIETDSHFGFVRKLNMRNTLVETFGGQMKLIPNRLVFEKALTNYSYTGRRRVDFIVPVPFDTDPDEARQVAEEAIKKLPFLMDGRPVEAFALEYGDRGLELQVRYWMVYPGDHDFFDGIHQGITAVKKAFDARGLRIAYPSRTLDFRHKEETAVSVRVAS